MKLKVHRHIFYYLLRLLEITFSVLPYRLCFTIGSTLGHCAYYLLPRERNKALKNLTEAFSQKTLAEKQAISKRMFTHFGQSLTELLCYPRLEKNLDQFISARGFHYLDDALIQGKGAVVVISHFGNWELMGAYTAKRGFPCSVIARNVYFKKYNQWLVALRNRMNVKTFYKDQSVHAMSAVLRQNGLLGVMADQEPSAPIRFAQIHAAPLIPIFIVRQGMRHQIIVEAPIEPDPAVWLGVQEKYLQANPHLWSWNHKNWKIRPFVNRLNIKIRNLDSVLAIR